YTVFVISGPDRRAFACIPRDRLDTFLDALHAGRLDPVIGRYLSVPPNGRVLASWRQADVPGLYDRLSEDALGATSGLVPPEPDPVRGPWSRGADAPSRPPAEPSADRPAPKRPMG